MNLRQAAHIGEGGEARSDAEGTGDLVVVVGAGPVGLMLAGELRLGGARVVVLERLERPTTESRASTVHAVTAELFSRRGLLERFGPLRGGGPGHFGGIPLNLSGVDSPYAGQWKLAQTDIERELAAWASGLGAEIRRGHTVTGLTELDDRVIVAAEGPAGPAPVTAAYVVGCDGEDSSVRRMAGFDFPGSAATRELLRADVAGVDVPDRRFERHPGGLAIAGRRPDGVTRVMVHEFGRPARVREGAPSFEEVAAAWRRVTGDDISCGDPLWLNSFGDACRQVSRYRAGRILLAGDAAHVQMPVGGQALNLGLQDAVNLGWKLAAEVRGDAPAGLLDSYHEERHAAGARVLGNIAAQATVLLGGAETDALREVFGELMALDPVRAHLAGAISQVSLRYPAGAAVDPGEDAVGARMPWWPVEVASPGGGPVGPVSDGRGMLLDLRDEPLSHERLGALVGGWADRVRTVAGRSAGRDGLWLIRPDGYVAWRGGADTGLTAALRRWFGEPASVPVGSASARRPAR
ncbi:FAD-dependent monooxygenase [Streptomyces sp. NPDC014870]|uniref:FAD-dependent monooxygenase n=1 Tax=Streptomyces sp. NPDC014870 TaxID=3364925 RepID=UPI0036FA86AE